MLVGLEEETANVPCSNSEGFFRGIFMFSCASILPKHNELVDLGLFIVFCYLQEPCQAGRFLGCIIYFWPLKKKQTN